MPTTPVPVSESSPVRGAAERENGAVAAAVLGSPTATSSAAPLPASVRPSADPKATAQVRMPSHGQAMQCNGESRKDPPAPLRAEEAKGGSHTGQRGPEGQRSRGSDPGRAARRQCPPAKESSILSTGLKWLKHMAYLVYSVVMLAWEVAAGVIGIPIATPEYKALKGQLAKAQSYPEWRAIGRMLDDLDGFGEWRTEEASAFFNFEGVMHCMQELAELKRSGNTQALLDVLLCRVHRSLYGVNNSQLYQFRTGTKNIIHSYTSLVCYLIWDLANISETQPPSLPLPLMDEDSKRIAPSSQWEQQREPMRSGPSFSPDVSVETLSGIPFHVVTPQQRHDALQQMRVVYGCTALILNGGILVGPLHLGVAKALYEADLLPQVIYGYRAGAIVAALLCCAEDPPVLRDNRGVNFQSVAGKDARSTTLRRWRRLWREGHLMDVGVLLRFMKDNVGEVTFKEAHQRTGRILNLQYTSFYKDEATGRTQRCSCLLNYLTAPDVLVYSAAVSSLTSMPVMFSRVPLLARRLDGTVGEYDPAVLVRSYPQQLSDDERSQAETSLHRLRELFHVQYFIVSECSAVVKPVFLRRQEHSGGTGQVFVAWLHFVLVEVVRLVWWLLCLTPLEPYLATAMDNDMAECGATGDTMVLIPRLSWRDLRALWGSLSRNELHRCVVASERQVWPRLEEIRMSQAVEHAITDTLSILRECNPFDIKA